MPPLFAILPNEETHRERVERTPDGPILTGETINVYGHVEKSAQDAPDGIRRSHFTQRPARVQNVVRFSPMGRWCRDSFGGMRMHPRSPQLATPRGAMHADTQRANVTVPPSTSFGQLVERISTYFAR